MPAISIDTFFACSLIVSVAIIATAFMAGTMQTQITSMQNLNEQEYLRNIADHIESSYGHPENWGSSGAVPVDFGLSAANSQGLSELDLDKITRLNSQNIYALSYPQIFTAARLDNIALGVSVTQILQINAALYSNISEGDVTSYTFQISVSQDSGPTSANLHCYVLASSFMNNTSSETSSAGLCFVTFKLPNSVNGSALLVVFARATFDDRLTSYEAYPFSHLSMQPEPNHTFLELSPLNHTLTVTSKESADLIENVYAFTYFYQSKLASTSNNTYSVPSFIDRSPTLLLCQGTNGTVQFNEWTTYPQIPLDCGADFSNSETNSFNYIVTVNGVLYRLTLRFGDVVK